MDGAVEKGPSPDRRRTIRRQRTELSWLGGGLRSRPGLDGALVHLSAGGALVETPTGLRSGARTILRLTGVAGSWTVASLVSRSWVAAIDAQQGVVYRGALVFDKALDPPAVCGEGPASHRDPS